MITRKLWISIPHSPFMVQYAQERDTKRQNNITAIRGHVIWVLLFYFPGHRTNMLNLTKSGMFNLSQLVMRAAVCSIVLRWAGQITKCPIRNQGKCDQPVWAIHELRIMNQGSRIKSEFPGKLITHHSSSEEILKGGMYSSDHVFLQIWKSEIF